MNRRDLLKLLGIAAVAPAELIVPKRTIFLPPRGGWVSTRQSAGALARLQLRDMTVDVQHDVGTLFGWESPLPVEFVRGPSRILVSGDARFTDAAALNAADIVEVAGLPGRKFQVNRLSLQFGAGKEAARVELSEVFV